MTARRSGKGSVALNSVAHRVMQDEGRTVGISYHSTTWCVAPSGRRSMIHLGYPYLSNFLSKETIDREIENEIFIEFINGSTPQFIGPTLTTP